jgi:hypothetical protein
MVSRSAACRGYHAIYGGHAYGGLAGNEVRACPDAAATIATVVQARRWCSAVNVSAIRAGIVE